MRFFHHTFHAFEFSSTSLRIPFVHQGCLMIQVENFVGRSLQRSFRSVSSRQFQHYAFTFSILQPRHQPVTFSLLTCCHRQLRIDLQGEIAGRGCSGRELWQGVDGEITDADIRCGIEPNITVDATEAPEILIFQITAVAILVNLYGYLVLACLQIRSHVKFARLHRTLRISHLLAVNPYIEGAHHALEAQEGLTVLTEQQRVCLQLEATFILSGRIAFLVGGPVLLGCSHHIRRIDFKGITCRYIDRCTISVHLPIGWYRERFPVLAAIVSTIEIHDSFLRRLRPSELPFTVEQHLAISLLCLIRHECSPCRFPVDGKHMLVFPVMVLCSS